jgi:D-lactate dehydrogenase (cytochrome)
VPDDPAIAAALAELRAAFGERLSLSAAQRAHHSQDFAHPQAPPPDAVVFALSTAEVAAVMRICATHRLPVIAYGAGTSIEGQLGAPHGGVCIDLSSMDQVLRVNERDLDVTVQPGVTRAYRYRDWPSASARRTPTSRRPASWRRSAATSATAIFT